jgi:hypothetical protein
MSKLEEEVRALRAKVAELRDELACIKKNVLASRHPVEVYLAQRGFPVRSHGDPGRVLFPPSTSADCLDELYELMRRYSFRLFLRDLIQTPRGMDGAALSRYCSPRTARSYLASLLELGIVRTDHAGGYELIPQHVISFGPTLEWYVSEIFQREFLAPTLSSVRLQNTQHGGDYDVIALLNRHLVYVEVKSSPPRGVEQSAVAAFLNRLRDLRPHVAIFLVDTQLRMKDKIVPMFEELIGTSRRETKGETAVHRLVKELFQVDHALYLANSRKGIYSNLKVCLQDFFRLRKATRLPVQG